jgi:hypothetical protein
MKIKLHNTCSKCPTPFLYSRSPATKKRVKSFSNGRPKPATDSLPHLLCGLFIGLILLSLNIVHGSGFFVLPMLVFHRPELIRGRHPEPLHRRAGPRAHPRPSPCHRTVQACPSKIPLEERSGPESWRGSKLVTSSIGLKSSRSQVEGEEQPQRQAREGG